MSHTEEIIALGLTFLVHVLGAVALIWAMLDDERGWRAIKDWWPRDDDPRRDDDDPVQGPDGPRGLPAALPMPTAEPSAVRLREPGRIGEQKPRPARRPEHEPTREPARH